MTTPTGAISLLDAQNEFGGTSPISLSEYYRGGTYVPSGTAAGTSGVQIATSGAIHLGDFRGVSAATVGFGGTLGASIASPEEYGWVWVTVNTNGSLEFQAGYTDYDGFNTASTVNTGAWYSPLTAGIGSSYWVKCTMVTGTVLSSNNTWLQLSALRRFSRDTTGFGKHLGTYRLYIATAASDGNIVATSAIFTMQIS